MAKKFDAKAKAKRQKIIAGVLCLVLLGALAWAVPSVLSSMNKKPPTATAVAPPPPAVAPPAGAPPVGTPVAAAVPASATLADSDPSPQPGTGQLLSFDRFQSKDPFAQQATTPKTPAAPTKLATPAKSATPPPAPPPPPAASKPSTAKISVNGAAEEVSVGSAFPSDDPVFKLVSLTSSTAKVAVAGGSLSSGASTLTLTKGKKVTLMNTADGTRYQLVLVSVG
jgi:hypothetical protein